MAGTTHYQAIRHELRDGDVLLYANGGLLGRLYKYTHAELVKINRDSCGDRTSVSCTGFREFQGARTLSLSSQVRRFPGRIDVYRPTCTTREAWVAAELLARQAGKRYSWWSIAVAFLWHCTLIRFLTGWKPGPDDSCERPSKWAAAKVCSSSVVWAFRTMLGKERVSEWPCRHLPIWRCWPQSIADDTAFFALVYEGLTP